MSEISKEQMDEAVELAKRVGELRIDVVINHIANCMECSSSHEHTGYWTCEKKQMPLEAKNVYTNTIPGWCPLPKAKEATK